MDALPLIDNDSAFQMAVAFASFCGKSYKVMLEDVWQKISRDICGDILQGTEGAAVCHKDEDIFTFDGWRYSNATWTRCTAGRPTINVLKHWMP